MSRLLVYKDKDLKITDCNQSFLDYTGFKDVTEVKGMIDEDFSHCKHPELYRAHEMEVLSGKNYGVIQPADDCHGRDFYIFNSKYSLTDKQGKITGIGVMAMEVTATNVVEIVQWFLSHTPNIPTHLTMGRNQSIIFLTKREHECLFYLLRGQPAPTIAKIMCLSKRTIETYVDQLKDKFLCDSKPELVAKAIHLGYMNDIPSHLLHTNLLNVLKQID